MLMIIGIIGLAFFGYCTLQVLQKWNYYNTIEKALWFIVIGAGSGFCLFLIRR